LFLGVLIAPPCFSQSVDAIASAPQNYSPPIVATASSFRAVWPSILSAYRRLKPYAQTRVSFASSGLLSTQMLHGAPFELFLSADKISITRVQNAGKNLSAPYALAQGGLHLVSRQIEEPSLATLRAAIDRGEPLKLAIANPRHAPYGQAARDALKAAAIWPSPTNGLLQAENASQALQFALSRAADIAIIPSSLAQELPKDTAARPIAPAYEQPVVHYLSILQNAGPESLAFASWLKTADALTVLQQFGFTAVKTTVR